MKSILNKRDTFFSLIFVLSLTFSLFGQNQQFKEFKGVVKDSDTRKPLVFADLSIEGTNISTITNTEGEFLLKVPEAYLSNTLQVSFLGYETKTMPITSLKQDDNTIYLTTKVTQLSQVNINMPKSALKLVQEMLKRKGNNYFSNSTIMTAFYRETIKKRRKNASLSEAVIEIYKTPYNNAKNDVVKLIKARKNTNYSRLDTVALKLQGGPYNTVYTDLIKYPRFVFDENNLSEYHFSFAPTTQINNRLVYVVNFEPQPYVSVPLYYGKLFIDAETFALVSAIYNLNVENRELASEMFVKRKPKKVKVYPTEVAYRADYRIANGKWYFGYSNVRLTFKINWKHKLFNSVYTLSSEMAVTDWQTNTTGQAPKGKERLKPSVILADEASGFADPEFWGEYNIIEPEKSIESAIKKISRQLKRSQSK